ncbi:MAG: alkaline phosphatase family protein [Nocardioidaceae bacterium]
MSSILAVAALTAACMSASPQPPASGASTAPSTSAPNASAAAGSAVEAAAGAADNRVNHVVAVSVDGLNPKALKRLGRARTPHFHRLFARGAGTMNARTLRESTSTLPNHTGMLTGRRVDAGHGGHGGHGVIVNKDPGGTVHDTAGEHVDSVFTTVHDRGGATALYAGKDKFNLFQRTWNPRFGGPDRIGVDNGSDKLDRYVLRTDTGVLVKRLRRQLANRPPEFALLHLRLPDAAGHAHGYMGRAYLRAVRRTDVLLGRLMRTINGRRALRRHTALILTADHGGHRGGHSHSNPRRLAHYRIPFVVWGATVARGADLYALNRDRARPGTRRTTYRARQPIRNAEVANLAADLLDVRSVPGSEFDARQTLDVRRR